MPRPLINVTRPKDSPSYNEHKVSIAVNPTLLEKRLRHRRSHDYVEAIKQLDIAGSQMDQSSYDAFVDAVKREFPDVNIFHHLLGIVAKCYLGDDYEVHTLDITGAIVQHYKCSESMPVIYNRARSLALNPAYEFIEVYTDLLRAVRKDGNVSVIK